MFWALSKMPKVAKTMSLFHGLVNRLLIKFVLLNVGTLFTFNDDEWEILKRLLLR